MTSNKHRPAQAGSRNPAGSTAMPARQGAFFGRRKGRPLREQQRELFAALLPELQLDLSRPAPRDLRGLFAARPASPTRRDLFAARLPPQASLSNPGVLFTAPAALAGTVENVRLEIGFGGGEHLLHEAARRPASGFIGIEPFVNGMAKMLAALAAAPQKAANIRLYHNDALQILNWLPANSLAGIDIFYPDPWPKKKHWKRRFINAGTLEHFARLLQSGGILRFASDIDSYINQVLQLMRDHKAFSWAAETAKDWQIPYNAWPGTRYEAKARQAGRKPAYLTFIRR